MKVVKIPPNLTVVDFESLIVEIDRSYYQFIIDDSSLKDKDKKALRLYCLYKVLVDTLKISDSYRNTIFYTNSNRNSNYWFDYGIFKMLKKTFPFIHLDSEHNFDCLNSLSGEHVELTNLIRDVYSKFDFSKFSRRKMQNFLDHRKIKISFPT